MTTKTDTKSPFELRMEMIATAKDMLEKQFEVNKEFTMKSWELAVEAAQKASAAIPAMPSIPKYPTLDEITALAKKMNDFVSGFGK